MSASYCDWADHLSMSPETLSVEALKAIRKEAGDVLFIRALAQLRQDYRRKMLASGKNAKARAHAQNLGGLVARMGSVLLKTGDLPEGTCLASRLTAHANNIRKEACFV